MHIIICGAGRVGLGLVDRLATDRADIVVIDPDGRSHKRAMAGTSSPSAIMLIAEAPSNKRT